MGRPWKFRSGRPRDGQIGSLGDFLGTLEGDVLRTSWGPIFASWVTDKDYAHAQNVFKELKLKNLGDYHALYVQSDTSLLADVFENFRNNCIEIYELDPAHFLHAPG